jgi:hypothetical protein
MKTILALVALPLLAMADANTYTATSGLATPTGRRAEVLHWRSARGGETHNMVVVHPKDKAPDGGAPLFVVLHGHGMNIVSEFRWEAMPIDDVHKCDICWVPENFYGLLLEVKDIEDWWGIPKTCVVPKEKGGEREAVPPDVSETERRVLEQVEWAASNLPVDRDRIYLGGASMGGSGTLGLGLCNGDVFAAVKACVSASPYHCLRRMGFDGGASIRQPMPDPPPLVEFSAQNDRWSKDKNLLYAGMETNRYAIFGYWGPWNHSGRNSVVWRKNDLVGSFDIFDVDLKSPYVAFTHASTDEPLPWPEGFMAKNELGTSSGQRNAYFRWKNVADNEDRFEVELRLITDKDWTTKIFTLPAESVADVTPRRIQSFSINAGEKVAWEYAGKTGTAVADATGHVTIPQLSISTESRTLVLRHILPRTGTSVARAVTPRREPGEAALGLDLGGFAGSFITVDGGKQPGEVGEIAVLRAPVKADFKEECRLAPCPLVVVCSAAPYKDAITGGEAIVPAGSWTLFVEVSDKEKDRDALCARVSAAVRQVALLPGVNTKSKSITFVSSGKGTEKTVAELITLFAGK